MPIRAVIFDVGGVILRTEKQEGRRKWEMRLALKERELSQIVWSSAPSARATVGKGTESEVWAFVASLFKLTDEQLQELQRDFWSGDHLDEELMRFVRDLRPRYRTGIITNAWPGSRTFLTDKLGIADAFDTIVISAEEGVAKPDLSIYKIAVERLDTKFEEAVFVDDVAENTQAARALGMHGVEFKNTQQAVVELGALLNSTAP
jgi:epoxide hydrolase-like predicted phosphatase